MNIFFGDVSDFCNFPHVNSTSSLNLVFVSTSILGDATTENNHSFTMLFFGINLKPCCFKISLVNNTFLDITFISEITTELTQKILLELKQICWEQGKKCRSIFKKGDIFKNPHSYVSSFFLDCRSYYPLTMFFFLNTYHIAVKEISFY